MHTRGSSLTLRVLQTLLSGLLLGMLIATSPSRCLAQGRSIPRGSEAQSQVEALPDELPEGQKYRYKLLNGLSLSVDLFDPLLYLFTSDHCGFQVQAMLDLHHRFFPMATFGMGLADETSDNGLEYGTGSKQDCRFKSPLAPFGKVGMAYNLKYNDTHPDDFYSLFARYGIAHNTADITNLYYADDNWGAYGPISITDQAYTTQWLELGAMIRVHIVSRFSLGWDLYWKVRLAQSGTEFGRPYYVPGMGTTETSLGFSFRLYYDIF